MNLKSVFYLFIAFLLLFFGCINNEQNKNYNNKKHTIKKDTFCIFDSTIVVEEFAKYDFNKNNLRVKGYGYTDEYGVRFKKQIEFKLRMVYQYSDKRLLIYKNDKLLNEILDVALKVKSKTIYRCIDNKLSNDSESEAIYEFSNQNKQIATINGDKFSVEVDENTYHSYYLEGDDFFDY